MTAVRTGRADVSISLTKDTSNIMSDGYARHLEALTWFGLMHVECKPQSSNCCLRTETLTGDQRMTPYILTGSPSTRSR
jgi:hypothetical protein